MKVRISYSPVLKEIGTIRDVPDDEAKVMIREGRAVAYTAEMAEQDARRPTPPPPGPRDGAVVVAPVDPPAVPPVEQRGEAVPGSDAAVRGDTDNI